MPPDGARNIYPQYTYNDKSTRRCHDIAKALRESGTRRITELNYLFLPIHLAAFKGCCELIKILLNYSAQINGLDNFGNTALMIAVKNNQISTLEYLIAQGADLNIDDCNGMTPVHVAIKLNFVNVARLLVNSGADINKKSREGLFPLFLAVSNEDEYFVWLLLRRGAEVNACNSEGLTALHEAIYRTNVPLGYEACPTNLEILSLLISYGGDVRAKTRRGLTPLYFAASCDDVNVAKFLLDSNAGIDDCNLAGSTALHEAAREGHLKMVKLLLDYGADKGCKNKALLSPYDYACMYDHFDVVVAFLKHNRTK